MLKLSIARGIQRIEVAPGAVLNLRPVKPEDMLIARSAAATFATGVPEEEANPIIRAVIMRTLVTRCLESWEGIGDMEGNEIALTRDPQGRPTGRFEEALGAVLTIPSVYAIIERQFLIPLFGRDEEKNASSPSPNGITAGASPAVQERAGALLSAGTA